MLALAGNLISLAINVPGIAGFNLQLLYDSGIRHTIFVWSTKADEFLITHIRSAQKIRQGLFAAEFLAQYGCGFFHRHRLGPNPGFLQTGALAL